MAGCICCTAHWLAALASIWPPMVFRGLLGNHCAPFFLILGQGRPARFPWVRIAEDSRSLPREPVSHQGHRCAYPYGGALMKAGLILSAAMIVSVPVLALAPLSADAQTSATQPLTSHGMSTEPKTFPPKSDCDVLDEAARSACETRRSQAANSGSNLNGTMGQQTLSGSSAGTPANTMGSGGTSGLGSSNTLGNSPGTTGNGSGLANPNAVGNPNSGTPNSSGTGTSISPSTSGVGSGTSGGSSGSGSSGGGS